MEDIIGNAYGLDIIGRCPQPLGNPYYALNNYGWPGAIPCYPNGNGGPPPEAMMAPGGVNMSRPGPDGMAGMIGRGGWGPGAAGPWGGDLLGCLAQLVQPLLVQQNLEPNVGLAPRCPTRSRTEFVGFEGCDVPPCGTVTLRCSPCVWLKIIRFVIPSSIASQITVDQITINGKETLINCGPVPGEMFLPDATYIETIATETIQPGCCIEIQITNISNATLFVNMGGVARVVY